MQEIGVIGVGDIGKRFVKNLLAANYDVSIYDINNEQVKWACDQGAHST